MAFSSETMKSKEWNEMFMHIHKNMNVYIYTHLYVYLNMYTMINLLKLRRTY